MISRAVHDQQKLRGMSLPVIRCYFYLFSLKRLGFGPVVKYLPVNENEFIGNESENLTHEWDRAVVAASEKYSNLVHNIFWFEYKIDFFELI